MTDKFGGKLPCTADAGTVTILAPKIKLSTSVVDFGEKAIRSTYRRELTVTNVGTETLHLQSVSVEGEIFSADIATKVIAPGDDAVMVIGYVPSQRQEDHGSLTVISDAMNGTQTITLHATAYSVNELHLSPVSGNSGETVTVSVRMNNMEPIAATQFSLLLPDGLRYVSGSVTSSHATHTAFARENSQQLTLMTYSASSDVIGEGDSQLLTFSLLITGQSGSYSLQPEQVVLGTSELENVCSSAMGAAVRVQSPRIQVQSTLSLGRCPLAAVTGQSLSITNVGENPLVVSRITAGQPFAVHFPSPQTVAPGASLLIDVKASPLSEGAMSGLIDIFSNDPSQPMYSVEVTGLAYAPNDLCVQGQIEGSKVQLQCALANYSEVSALQFDVHFPCAATAMPNATVSTERLAQHAVNLVQLDEKTCRAIIYNLSGTAIGGHEGELCTMSFLLTDASVKQCLAVVDDIKLSSADSRNLSSTSTLEVMCEQSALRGDVNRDGVVDVSDAVAVINHYLAGTADPQIVSLCDINGDGIIDVSDAVLIINIYLGK